MASRSSRPAPRTDKARRASGARRVRDAGAADGNGVLSPELARFFDAMASHFPGHMMQRLMRPDGTVRYTYVSPGIAALGLDRTAILAAETSKQDWLHPDDAGRWQAALSTSAATLQVLDEEVRILGIDGRVRWVRSIGNPRRLSSGDVVWDGIALDVTEVREALDAMRLSKAQADRAEGQKARLLASLEARLAAPSALLRGVHDKIVSSISHGTAMGDADLHAIRSDMMKVLDMLTEAVSRRALSETGDDADPRLAALTRRQREVLTLVAEAKSNREIAESLGLTEGTVKLHVVGVLRALGLNNRTQAATLLVKARA
jgi:DNA-binding NarL/FixJ family response regulator